MACRDCYYYTFEGEDKKGYCSYYKQYYYPTESCRYEKRSSSGGCFMTTACCEYKGLPDDCHELTQMRYIRDSYLKQTQLGNGLISLYYEEAPHIVQKIMSKANKQELLEQIYQRITDIVSDIDLKKYDEAISKYVLMMMWCERI